MKSLWPAILTAAMLAFGAAAGGPAAEESPQENVAKLLARSLERLDEGQLERAESDAREALGISLDQMGALYAALGEYELAEKAYREAIRASVSASSSALMGLSILDLRRGRYEDGIKTANQILGLNPLHPGARHVLGKIHFMQGNFEQAASDLSDSYRIRSSDPSVAYTLGLTYLKLRRPAEARKVFQEMTARLGRRAELHVLYGRAYRVTEYLDEAIVEFKRAIELNPSLPRVHAYLGLTYLLKKDSSGFPEAIEEFDAELRNEPNSYFANYYLGIIYTTSRENQKAVTHLRNAIGIDPENPDPWLHLGQALFQSGEFQQSADAMRRCIELTGDPARNNYQVANAHYVLGRSLLSLGLADQAKRELEESQRLKAQRSESESRSLRAYLDTPPGEPEDGSVSEMGGPSGARAVLDEDELDPQARQVLQNTASTYRTLAAKSYENMARIETARSAFESAARLLRRAIDWDAALPDASFNLGVALLKGGDLESAVDALIDSAQAGPAKPETLRLLADLALRLVEKRSAEAASKAVSFLLRGNPQVAELHVLAGHLAAQQSRFDEAVDEYRLALRQNPRLPDANYSLGTVLIRRGNFDEAQQAFEDELKLNPDHPGALYHRAYILLSKQQSETAIEILERVVRLAPGYADAYYQLGKAQLDKEQLLLATANLETAAHLNPNASHVFYQLSRAYLRSGRKREAESALAKYRVLKKEEEDKRLSRMKQQTPD